MTKHFKTQDELQNERVEKSLSASTAEGSFTSASVNMTSNYVTPYALSLGATNSQVGILNAAQNFASTIAQLPAARLPDFMSRKSIWYVCHIIARLLWIPVILIAFLPLDSKILGSVQDSNL